jgi:hypothetical protein
MSDCRQRRCEAGLARGVDLDSSTDVLSFNNLAESHILKAMRRVHGLPHQKIRRALQELSLIRNSAIRCWMKALRRTALICLSVTIMRSSIFRREAARISGIYRRNRISTSVIVGRFNARDSIADLADEYQIDAAILEDAIRWEMSKAA